MKQTGDAFWEDTMCYRTEQERAKNAFITYCEQASWWWVAYYGSCKKRGLKDFYIKILFSTKMRPGKNLHMIRPGNVINKNLICSRGSGMLCYEVGTEVLYGVNDEALWKL